MGATLGVLPVRQQRSWTRSWTTTAVAMITIATTALALWIAAAPSLLSNPLTVVGALIVAGGNLVLAFVVARTNPGNLLSPLLAALALIVVPTNMLRPDAIPALEGSWMLLYLAPALILVCVPTGHPASRRWAAVAILLTATTISFGMLVGIQMLWPTFASPGIEIAATAHLLPFLALLIACAAAPIARYRRSNEWMRLQLRWVLVAGLSLPLTLLLCWTSYLVLGTSDLVAYGLVIMLIAIPVGATIGLVQPRLFDVDRALVAVVSGLVLLGAVLLVLSVAAMVVGLPVSDWDAIPAAAVSVTLVIAAGFAYPFVARGFDRVFSPERGRTLAQLRRLSVRVEQGDAPPEDLQAVLRSALRDSGLRVGYRRIADGRLVDLETANSPRPAAASTAHSNRAIRTLELTETSVIVRARHEEIGAIVPSEDRIRRPAVAIARAAAPFVDAIRMRAELARANADLAEINSALTSANTDLKASRERLLRVEYAERQRLERDLHDGAQQRLVALGMQLRVLQRTRDLDHVTAEGLDEAVAQLGTAVAELRQFAHGVRPSALKNGLSDALAELEHRSPDLVELDVQAGTLPEMVATTAYFVVNEAITNALRHADASRIQVRVRQTDRSLHLSVTDNGRGGATLDSSRWLNSSRALNSLRGPDRSRDLNPSRGSSSSRGLSGIAERVHTIGGEILVDSEVGCGTRVEVTLPCAS